MRKFVRLSLNNFVISYRFCIFFLEDPAQDEGQATSKKKDKKKKKGKESAEDEKKAKRKPNKSMIKV